MQREFQVMKKDLNGKVWYLPHHPVINEKKTSKVRPVFDCAVDDNVCDDMVANTVQKSFYVDDCLKFVTNENDAINVISKWEKLARSIRICLSSLLNLKRITWPFMALG